MTAGSLSLAEFLLARIEADERAAEKLSVTDRRPVLSLASTVNHPERLLLECAAKRRIVEGIVPERDPYAGHPDYDPLWIFRELAAVYAHHKDYRDEWTP